ncbi:hypothetical protein [Alienimonas californiensis]|uniref:Glycoside hydrolase family 42 N-terminal domain-containing protein n=1 Tax=Alienimonas californiensis TaxID=2527989 RepID=A0A517P6G8_9PLAN|nr:hypothetical protein [Alienimonas californiensis]QDT14970.1 hypothetical protein CA12_10500 [Alienimonas californiensis]
MLALNPSLLAAASVVWVLAGPAGVPAADAVVPETPLTTANSWAFDAPDDPYTDAALLDLRALNEAQSGQSGFVRLSENGMSFTLGNGEPVRFWAVGTDANRFDPDQMDRHARWLAKRGVNLCRLHVTVAAHEEGDALADVNDELIAGCHRFIKSCKDAGIYVLISPYYAHFVAPKSWNLPGGTPRMEGLVYVDPKVQAAYKVWTREFYARVNPHTGLSIAEDPTVAMLQILNEDSLLFWTAQRLPEPYREILADAYSKWLTEKYGSVAAAWAAWGDGYKGKDDLDDLENGRLGPLRPYDLTLDAAKPAERALRNRLKDTAEFLARYQRDFYAEMGRYLREDLGCKQVLNATNWRTANDAKLKGLERYSLAALDWDAENEYVGSDYQHRGENDSYRIDPGHYLVNESVLGKPLEMCTNFRQRKGAPFIVTETAWKNPNRYQSEGPFLVAAYQSLTGIDGIVWFAMQTPGFETDPNKPFWQIGDQMSVHKWSHGYPAQTLGFPAAALLYRRGDLQQADPVILERRTEGEVFDRQPPRLTDDETYGDARDQPELRPDWTPGKRAGGAELPRAAFLVGPVVEEVVPAGASGEDVVSPYLDKQIDRAAGKIHAATGELMWDYKQQICVMEGPRAQGVTGFLKDASGLFVLEDVTIESRNDYATVQVVSLDDAPLKDSESVLVQVVTANRLTGYRTEPATFAVGSGDNAYEVAGERITNIGKAPLRLANAQVAVTMANPKLTEAVILDVNGYPVRTLPIVGGRFEMPADAVYAVLRPGR